MARQPLLGRAGRARRHGALLERGSRQALRDARAVWDAFAGFRGFFWSDPPQYTAYRHTWTRAFKPRLKGLAAVVQATVDELLDEVSGAPVVDVVSALAFPLPATVIFSLLGVPREDRDMFRRVSAALMAGG